MKEHKNGLITILFNRQTQKDNKAERDKLKK